MPHGSEDHRCCGTCVLWGTVADVRENLEWRECQATVYLGAPSKDQMGTNCSKWRKSRWGLRRVLPRNESVNDKPQEAFEVTKDPILPLTTTRVAMTNDLDFKRLNVPPTSDPSWIATSAPLLAFFQEGDHTVDEIVIWGRNNGHSGSLIRHLLAYLSFAGQVHYDDGSKVWKVGSEAFDEVASISAEGEWCRPETRTVVKRFAQIFHGSRGL